MMKTAVRFSLIASGAFAICAAAAAEPPKVSPAKPAQAQPRPTQIALASADSVRPPSPASSPRSEPVKRPAPRITTCRCGDPQPDPENQDR